LPANGYVHFERYLAASTAFNHIGLILDLFRGRTTSGLSCTGDVPLIHNLPPWNGVGFQGPPAVDRAPRSIRADSISANSTGSLLVSGRERSASSVDLSSIGSRPATSASIRSPIPGGVSTAVAIPPVAVLSPSSAACQVSY